MASEWEYIEYNTIQEVVAVFSIYHCAWLIICAGIIAGCLYYVGKRNTEFIRILDAAVVVSLLSETVKIVSMIRFVPLSDGTGSVPYLELNHLPLHFCSLQILLILTARYASLGTKQKHTLLTFMYPTCILGALMALLMPSIYTTSIRASQSFTHPMAYQFFLFHTMLIILGVCIYREIRDELTPEDYRSTLMLIVFLALISVYLNSVFAIPHYQRGDIVSVKNYTHFFFTYVPPVPVRLTQKWHWLLYLFIIFLLCAGLLALMYYPVFRKLRKGGKTV